MNALCTNGQTNTATSEGLDAGGCTSANSRTVWYKFYALLFAYILVDLCIKEKDCYEQTSPCDNFVFAFGDR
jgi:hypothetical protein